MRGSAYGWFIVKKANAIFEFSQVLENVGS